MGLAKKVPAGGPIVGTGGDGVFGGGGGPPAAAAAAWYGVIAYSLQLYFDFSGYTDMALGLARMFNVRLPQNFNSPYQSRTSSNSGGGGT